MYSENAYACWCGRDPKRPQSFRNDRGGRATAAPRGPSPRERAQTPGADCATLSGEARHDFMRR